MKKFFTNIKKNVSNKLIGIRRTAAITAMTLAVALSGMMSGVAFADGGFNVKVEETDLGNASSLMGKIIGILLTITRFVGVALVVYGVYEIVMSFMQNQPEAKTKGIIMALAGVVMIALKSILQGIGVVA